MRKLLIIAAASLAITACGDKPAEDASTDATAKVEDKTSKGGLALTPAQKLAKEYVSIVETMTEAVQSVTDEATTPEALEDQKVKGAIRTAMLYDWLVKTKQGGNAIKQLPLYS